MFETCMKVVALAVVLAMFSMLAGCHSDQGPRLRVMSFNIRYDNPADGENQWSERREMVVDVIRAFDPDLLGAQECLAHQGEFLRERLPGYSFVGAGRDDGLTKGEMVPIFYRTDRFELIDSGHFWLSETPEVPGSRSWDAAITRMVTWVKLRDRRDKSALWHFNTHFDHQGEHARALSARLLREQLLAISGGQRTILTGDFNTAADGAVSLVLRVGERGGPTLLDTYREEHRELFGVEGTFNGFTGRETGARIDWILATPDFEVDDAAIDRTARADRWPSDHFPVTAVVHIEMPDE